MPPPVKLVLVLVGPTASGKTDVSVQLARLLNGEIISADSRQVYKFLAIGSAQPTDEQLASVRHHFVSELSPDHSFSAGEFGVRGRQTIDRIFRRGKTPLVVGGSGLYVQSLVDGFFEGPGADREFRDVLQRRLKAGRLTELIEELRVIDPVTAEKADPTKPRRIIRALEVYHLTGEPLSQYARKNKAVIDFTPVFFGLQWERGALYERIDKRCERMIVNGLLKEVDDLEEKGYAASLNALNTVGYAEAFAFRRGEVSHDEMVRLFKRNSRRYAKRQLTWFRRDKRIEWIRMDEGTTPERTAEEIASRFLTMRVP